MQIIRLLRPKVVLMIPVKFPPSRSAASDHTQPLAVYNNLRNPSCKGFAECPEFVKGLFTGVFREENRLAQIERESSYNFKAGSFLTLP